MDTPDLTSGLDDTVVHSLESALRLPGHCLVTETIPSRCVRENQQGAGKGAVVIGGLPSRRTSDETLGLPEGDPIASALAIRASS